MHDRSKIETGNETFEGNNWRFSDINLVDGAVEEFERRLLDAGWEDLDSMKVAFDEALVNAIAHGNLEVESDETTDIRTLAKKKQNLSPTDKSVFVSLEITGESIVVTIKDQGKGFEWDKIPDPTAPENLLKPFGRGDFFMRSGFDSVKRRNLDDGHEVTMVKAATPKE